MQLAHSLKKRNYASSSELNERSSYLSAGVATSFCSPALVSCFALRASHLCSERARGF